VKKDIDIEEMVRVLKSRIKEGNYYLCLGFDPEDAGRAIVVGKDGVFLEGAESIQVKEGKKLIYGLLKPIQNLEKYKDVILETLEISEKQKRPLCEKYLKDLL